LSSHLLEHIASIFAALFRSLPEKEEGVELSGRDRLLFKFMENNMEKMDRLLELRHSWWSKVAAVDVAIDERRRRQLKRQAS
jgi:beta-catenin-like protein 1